MKPLDKIYAVFGTLGVILALYLSNFYYSIGENSQGGLFAGVTVVLLIGLTITARRFLQSRQDQSRTESI